MKKITVLAAMLALLLSFQMACVPKPPDPVKMFWPPLPDEPRISYVRSIRSLSDLQDRTFLDVLFGKSDMGLFKQPYGLFAHDGKIYVADPDAGAVLITDQVEKTVKLLPGSSGVRIKVPIGVAAAADGTVFIADADKGVVLIFDNNGAYKGVIGGKGEMKRPVGLAVNADLGRLYITDIKDNAVHVYSFAGDRLISFGKAGVGDGEFLHPTNIAIDQKTDNVFITDTNNFRVQIFDKDGKFLSRFGELGDVPGMFSRPKGIGVDSEGNIYVADAAFGNVQVFSQEGRLLTFFGTSGYGPGQFLLPAGIYIDENDQIYVADQLNRRVQVFQYFSDKWKKSHPKEYSEIWVKP